MTISVVISVRNEGRALNRTLEFLAEEQQRHDLEIVIVDDGSDRPVTDVPLGVRLVRTEQREGIARARNRGAELATGDFLLFTDGHVFFSENALSELPLLCGDEVILGAQMQLLFDESQFFRQQTTELTGPYYFGWRFSLTPELCVVPNREKQSLNIYDVPYVGGGFLALSRRYFWALGGFDSELIGFGLEDAELALRCWAWGGRVRIAPFLVCYHYSAHQGAAVETGRSPLDVARYDGSFPNALRALYLHFPDTVFWEQASRLQRQFPLSWCQIDPDFPEPALEARRVALDARRVRSREWVLDRMTRA